MPAHAEINPFLKLVLELGPLAVFFFGNAYGDTAGDALSRRSRRSAAGFSSPPRFSSSPRWSRSSPRSILTRRLPIMPVVTGVVVLVFGGLTLALQDEMFIKMKPTIVNVLFGAALLGGLVFSRPLLGYVFDTVFRLDDEGWRKLTFRWGLFFFFLAVAERGGLAEFLRRRLGELQGVRHHAAHHHLHADRRCR